ncbi:MAG: type 4a pilus biogenesis protein PilO [Gammaproteobacteria bacterium]|nr:type 4a pilus biogenesis protein PilO [Gammaproteobacteria bacterium]
MNLNELDFQNVGGWPLAVRLSATFIVFALVLGGGFYQFTQNKIKELQAVESKEEPLKVEYRTKQGKAANLQAYTQQMAEMEERFGSMLRQLPQKTEVADLLIEISQIGLSNNLEFSLFKPSREIRKEFYAELPVNINVTGTYHDFGGFATGIAALPRIVTIHNVSMIPKNTKEEPHKNVDADKKLTIILVAKTYRYLDENETSPKKKKRRGRKK